jgi:hypothetical protein
MKRIKNWLVNYIAGHLFNFITENDFLIKKRDGSIFFKGKKLSQQETQTIAEEAHNIKSSFLYKLLINEMIHVANKKIYFDATTHEHLIEGKCTLWTIDVLTRKIDNIAILKK